MGRKDAFADGAPRATDHKKQRERTLHGAHGSCYRQNFGRASATLPKCTHTIFLKIAFQGFKQSFAFILFHRRKFSLFNFNFSTFGASFVDRFQFSGLASETKEDRLVLFVLT
ncbi:hypothetical protein CDAR_530901 [Caerostris darwini]|uniref:Uncharacterized protein n=1 Tax=Caerostris darwini TaxID=1538125 RepID=A0AAV4VS60_9ARAC|nr:hypothetical protein CDAR_530901 [Caerostris darwini]